MFNRDYEFPSIALAVSITFALLPAFGHDVPLRTVMNAFVKLEPHEIHLVIRMPKELLQYVDLPSNGPEYDREKAELATQRALTVLAENVTIWENGVRLMPSNAIGRLTLPGDRSFEDYDKAVAHLAEPMELGTTINYDQGYFDVHFVYPVTSPKSVFMVETTVAEDLQNYAKLSIRYLPLGESGRAFIISSQSGRVNLNPSWYQAAGGFIALGIRHILSGSDHLLFLFCLIIPFRKIIGLIPVITAFTIAHSVTLVGTAYNLAPVGAWFPPFVEMAIAASIVYMALENIVGADLRRRWLITGLFGLVHGFGFSYALKENLQFAGSHLLISLLSFNVGIEIGQLAVLTVMLAVLSIVLRGRLGGRAGIVVLSAIVAHTAWHWMIERWGVLRQTPGPSLDGPGLMILARWAIALFLAVAVVKLLAKWVEGKWPRRLEARVNGIE